MKRNLIPAIAIIVVAILLLLVNRYSSTTVLKEYAYLFIIAAMLFGYGIARFFQASDK